MGVLDGKVALVSGAARGQGEAEARRFAEEGAMVVLGDIRDDLGTDVADDIGKAARYVHLDVTSESDWDRAVEVAVSDFGAVDVLVNNAGTARATPIIGGALEDYLAVVMVNQVGVYLGMRAVAPVMQRAGGGSIVNISSIDGIVAMPMVSAYVASKFAVRGMTKVAALELAEHGIRCNSVHPGYIDTELLRGGGDTGFRGVDLGAVAASVPAKRVGTVEDVTDVVLFLASDASRYCSGAEIVVDGGLLAGIPLRS
ncbi:MAG TPA: glucose 1-dehydrogenase [Acidimicrobiales bacterium]|nr:glucose 1-dehydrogenase [Acidimicrobiales bacterium]